MHTNIDEDRRLEHLFWCPVQSFDWYHKYGDVVVFDTTYKVNAYDMPCAIFVGIDNHENTILFRCALLRNETTSTFKWLMKVFFFPFLFIYVHILIFLLFINVETFILMLCYISNADFCSGIEKASKDNCNRSRSMDV